MFALRAASAVAEGAPSDPSHVSGDLERGWDARRVEQLIHHVQKTKTKAHDYDAMAASNVALHKQLAEVRAKHTAAMSDLAVKGKRMEELMRHVIDERNRLMDRVKEMEGERLSTTVPPPHSLVATLPPIPPRPITVNKGVQVSDTENALAGIGSNSLLPWPSSSSLSQNVPSGADIGTQTEEPMRFVDEESNEDSGAGGARHSDDRSRIPPLAANFGPIEFCSETLPPTQVYFRSLSHYPAALAMYAMGRWIDELKMKDAGPRHVGAVCATCFNGMWEWRRINRRKAEQSTQRIIALGESRAEQPLWWCAVYFAALLEEYGLSDSDGGSGTPEPPTACELLTGVASTFATTARPLTALTLSSLISALMEDHAVGLVYFDPGATTVSDVTRDDGDDIDGGVDLMGSDGPRGPRAGAHSHASVHSELASVNIASDCTEALVLSVSVLETDALFYIVRWEAVMGATASADGSCGLGSMPYALSGEWVASEQLLRWFSSFVVVEHSALRSPREVRLPLTVSSHVGSVALRPLDDLAADLPRCVEAWLVDTVTAVWSAVDLVPRGDAFVLFSPTVEASDDAVVVLSVEPVSVPALDLCSVPRLSQNGLYASAPTRVVAYQLDGEEIRSSRITLATTAGLHETGEVETPAVLRKRVAATLKGLDEELAGATKRLFGTGAEGEDRFERERVRELQEDRVALRHTAARLADHIRTVGDCFAVYSSRASGLFADAVLTVRPLGPSATQVAEEQRRRQRQQDEYEQHALRFAAGASAYLSGITEVCASHSLAVFANAKVNLEKVVQQTARWHWLLREQAVRAAEEDALRMEAALSRRKVVVDACVGTATHAAQTAMHSSSSARTAAQLAMGKSQQHLLHQRFTALQAELVECQAQLCAALDGAIEVQHSDAQSAVEALQAELKRKEELLEQSREYREDMEAQLSAATDDAARLRGAMEEVERLHTEEILEKAIELNTMSVQVQDLLAELAACRAQKRDNPLRGEQ